MAEKLGPVLVCRLGHGNSDNGVLMLARARGAAAFTQAEAESSAIFGSRIGLALDLARFSALREQDLLLTDRERIARDLHDLVIQRLFAAGLSIQSLRRFTMDPVAHDRIAAVTKELDDTIRKLRDTIYSLRTADVDRDPLTGRILRVVRESSRSYGLIPKVSLDGPWIWSTKVLLPNCCRVPSEALSNALRHSGAGRSRSSLTVDGDEVQLCIDDNGHGFTEPAQESGLANMRYRAGLLAAGVTSDSVPGEGTSVTWSAPLS